MFGDSSIGRREYGSLVRAKEETMESFETGWEIGFPATDEAEEVLIMEPVGDGPDNGVDAT